MSLFEWQTDFLEKRAEEFVGFVQELMPSAASPS